MNRFTIFPIQNQKLWNLYEKSLSLFWTTSEINLSNDLSDWNKLNDNEKYFLKNVLAFFASSDGMVNENLVLNFYSEIDLPEAKAFYANQIMIETIHSHQYSLLIDTYINSTDEKNLLFNAIETIPAIKKKADWILKWIESGSSLIKMIPENITKDILAIQESSWASDWMTSQQRTSLDFFTKEKPSFEQRLLAFICVEGIFFSGSFCAIYWLKNRGLLPGLCTANEFISRDENMHAEFAILLLELSQNKIHQDVAHSIFKEAVQIETEFITESLPVSLLGMNNTLMTQYIQYVADRWLVLLGYEKIYNSPNPFNFMEMISLNTKENFFELNVTQYSKSGVGVSKEEMEIKFDEDF
jgi:ribonucleoside-diphosphate reductase beta chain